MTQMTQMKQKLKIKIKETVEEKRPLTDAEMELYDIYHMNNEIYLLTREILRFWRTQGFDFLSYDGNEGIFRKETIRDATPEEKMAYHMREVSDGYVRFHHCINVSEVLKDKVIIFEIEESE